MSLELETADTTPPDAPCPLTDPRPGGGILPAPLGEEDAARAQMAAIGLSAVGLSAEGPTADAFARAVITCQADLANPAKRAGMVHASSCAERVCRALDELGIQSPLFSEPYVTGQAPANVERILAETHASRGPRHRPGLGDVVCIGAPWHTFIVVGVDGDSYQTANGGEKTATGAQCIALVTRMYHPATATQSARFDARPLLDVGDAVALVGAARWLPPAALGQSG